MGDDRGQRLDNQPRSIWQVISNRSLSELELEIHANTTAFVKFMLQEEFLKQRRKLQIEIFIIDRNLEDLERNIFPHCDIRTLRQKFESAMALIKKKNKT